MSKKVLVLVLAAAMLLGLMPGVASAAVTSTTVNLYAGKDTLVGTVTVSADSADTTHLDVTYRITVAGWYFTEIHFAAATAVGAIPQSKGNPVPGKFGYSKSFDPAVNTDQSFIYPIDWTLGSPLYLAAHAVVINQVYTPPVDYSATIYSDEATQVTAGNEAVTYPKAAMLAHEAGDPPSPYPPGTWDNALTGYTFTESSKWIWETYDVVHPVAGDIVTFERQFTVTGNPTAGMLHIACDNGYEVRFNGQLVGSANLFTGWLGSNLKQPFVDTTGWQTVGNYDVTSKLVTGSNTLQIIGVNEYMNTDDVDRGGSPQTVGTVGYNPGGLIFELGHASQVPGSWTILRRETAWGATAVGANPFPGKNWATYFGCTLPVVP